MPASEEEEKCVVNVHLGTFADVAHAWGGRTRPISLNKKKIGKGGNIDEQKKNIGDKEKKNASFSIMKKKRKRCHKNPPTKERKRDCVISHWFVTGAGIRRAHQ